MTKFQDLRDLITSKYHRGGLQQPLRKQCGIEYLSVDQGLEKCFSHGLWRIAECGHFTVNEGISAKFQICPHHFAVSYEAKRDLGQGLANSSLTYIFGRLVISEWILHFYIIGKMKRIVFVTQKLKIQILLSTELSYAYSYTYGL